MPSSFMVKRNYAHCPLKKRPLALYNEPAITPEQEEPEDLSVKKPRLESSEKNYSFLPPSVIRSSSAVVEPLHKPSPYYKQEALCLKSVSPKPPQPIYYHSAHSLPSAPVHQPVIQPAFRPKTELTYHSKYETPLQSKYDLTEMPSAQENPPSLAEYYLQLFRTTSEEEAKRKEQTSMHLPWQSSSYLPPSPQTSPNNQDSYYRTSPVQPMVSPHFYSPVLHPYPETSALISPVSTCSTASESEEEAVHLPSNGTKKNVRHSCESCGKSYSTQSGLRKHNELHCSSLGPKAFSCKHCLKSYTSVGALKMHIRTHTLPCKCNVCGKCFSRPWLLQGHIRTHTGEKPFECNQCHRSFADRSNLRAHQQTHERIKKYACQNCKKTFSRMSLLNKHNENACVAIKSLSSPSVNSSM